MGEQRDFGDRALGGLDDKLAEGQERRRTLVGALDSGLGISLPVSAVLLAAGLGWTYAYVRTWPLLVGAACFVTAAVTGWIGLRGERGPVTTLLLAGTLALGVAGVACLGAGVA